MTLPLFIAAILLVLTGLAGFYLGHPSAGKVSMTALIPAFWGLALALCGFLSLRENLLRHAMHAAAAIALLGCLGAGMRLPKLWQAYTSGAVNSPLALLCHLAMTLVCLAFLILCIRSFILARRQTKSAGENP